MDFWLPTTKDLQTPMAEKMHRSLLTWMRTLQQYTMEAVSQSWAYNQQVAAR